jgi:hypothetical protein
MVGNIKGFEDADFDEETLKILKIFPEFFRRKNGSFYFKITIPANLTDNTIFYTHCKSRMNSIARIILEAAEDVHK